MDIDKEREAFEKWVTDDGKYPDYATRLDGTDTYKLITTHLYWKAWKARAELEDSINIQIEQKKGYTQ